MGKAKARKLARKKRVKASRAAAADADVGAPKSFVMKRGTIGSSVEQLMREVRAVMEPNTATRLEVRRQNVLKDFINVAGPLGVTHFLLFSTTTTASYLRIARIPRGPTIAFQLVNYALAKDVIKIQRRPKMLSTIGHLNAPLLVLNNFPTEGLRWKLVTSMLQNMFPPINVQTVQLSLIRRCVLFNFNADTERIEFRHYDVSAQPVGVSRSVRRVLDAKIPDLSQLNDIADFLMKNSTGQAPSDSEAEEAEDSHVTLSQRVQGRGNATAQQSAVKLSELGPRMVLQVVKIEQGICDGEVLYHRFVDKSKEEIEALQRRKQSSEKAKEERKRIQEENVRRKKAEKAKHRDKCRRKGLRTDESDGEVEEDDDAEYYRQEVGEEPEPDLFKQEPKRKQEKKVPHWQEKRALQKRKRGDEEEGGEEEDSAPSTRKRGKKHK